MISRRAAYFCALLAVALSASAAPNSRRAAPAAHPHESAGRPQLSDDSVIYSAPKDLALRSDGQHKAEALAHFVEGIEFEEEGEMEKALEAYRQVLNVDPGQVDLAVRVAALLSRDDEYPAAIDVLKDAVKVRRNAPEPYLELAFIYAKYLKKIDQALQYANKAIALDPQNIDCYQRLVEIQLAIGEEKKALATLDRAAHAAAKNPVFWARLGRLYSAILRKPDTVMTAEQTARLNEVYKKAAAQGHDEAAVLKEAADYFASTQQIADALPLYVRVLELQPDDTSVREKLASVFLMTNQRTRAIEMLETIIKEHPEKSEPYELLAQLHDDEARSLARGNQEAAAAVEFKKAAENYEQSLLVNPNRPTTYLRLAELLLAPLKQSARAVTLLKEARARYPDAPAFAYYLAIALREAKQPKEAVVTFEEALNEAQNIGSDILKPRFYLDYGAAAEQAALYDKAAELFRKAIALDPPNAAEAYNYLGYMWAEQNSHLEEAEDAVKRALQLAPDNGAYLDSLGWVQYRQGRYAEALENVQHAIQNLPREDGVVLEHLGDIYLKLDRLPQALAAWQKAKTLEPTNKDLEVKIESHKTQVSKSETPAPRP